MIVFRNILERSGDGNRQQVVMVADLGAALLVEFRQVDPFVRQQFHGFFRLLLLAYLQDDIDEAGREKACAQRHQQAADKLVDK